MAKTTYFSTSIAALALLYNIQAQAQPAPPFLRVGSEGLGVTVQWTEVAGASGYELFYAPFPFQGVASIGSADMGTQTELKGNLWQGAAFYVAVKAYDSNRQLSEFSNIGFVQIQDRGEDYRNFWRATAKEIAEKRFISDEYLYLELPNIETCFEGSVSDGVRQRAQATLNEIRKLHNLAEIDYDVSADLETQQAALIQQANHFLSHQPPTDSLCYSQAGFDGSNSSNLTLGNQISDPAENLIGFIDDAFNVSTVESVGHRRHLLNPFLRFTSYGQVLGAAAVKVSDFSDASLPESADIPGFVAVPYLRYPYLFFSDKTSNQATPWSLSVIEDKTSLWGNQYDYFSGASVSVTRKDNGKAMPVNNVFTDTIGSGVPNNLSWNVADWNYDTWYTVTVDNIRNRSGEIGSLSYDVFIDYQNIFDLDFPLEEGDEQNGRLLLGSLSNQDDIDSYELDLANTVTFSGTSQFANMAYFIRLYGPDKQLVISSDSSFTRDLQAGRYTVVIANCNEQQSCYTGVKNYTVQVD